MSNDEGLYSHSPQAGPSGGNSTASSSPAGAGILQSQQQQALAALSHQKAVQQQQQQQQHAQAQAQAQAAHAYAAMHAQQQAVNAAAAAAAFAANSQYPTTAPATPHSHTSPQSPVKVTPDTGTHGSLGGSGAAAASSPFSASGGGGGGSVASPAGSTFSAGAASSAHEHAAMAMAAESAAYGRATGMALAGATGLVGSSPVKGANMVISQSLGGMDVDQSSSPSTSSAYGVPSMMPGSGSVTPGAASAGTTFAYPGPPAGSTALSPTVLSQHPAPSMASTTSRHHPYAHASRPSLHTQTSASSIPLYLSSPSPVGGPPPTTPPPYGNVAEGTASGIPPPPTATSVAPQRVHSAPAHILTLQTQGTEGLGSPVASAEPDSRGALDQRRFVGDLAQQQQQQQQQHPHPRDMSSTDSILHLSTSSAPATTPATLVNPAASYQSGRPPSMTIDTAHASNALASLNAPQSAPPTSMEDSRMMVSTAAASANGAGYNEKVSAALVLLQKRLPIMGAALSTSETESGQDEEEIWKGIEGAYDELKRIMVKRKDGRRRLSHGSSSNNIRSFTTMELESPITPITPSDHLGSAFGASKSTSALAAPPPPPPPSAVQPGPQLQTSAAGAAQPPLLHSLSTPDVSLSASAAAVRQVAAAQAQAVQIQQQQAQQQAQHAQQQAQQQAQQAQAHLHHQQQQQQQHAQLQQAHMQAQIHAAAAAEAEQQMLDDEARARLKDQLQAEEDARISARMQANYEAEQRAIRMEADAHADDEAERRANFDAVVLCEAARRGGYVPRPADHNGQPQVWPNFQGDVNVDFNQAVHEEQLRLARSRLHQQMQEGATPGAPQILPNPPAPPPTPSPVAMPPAMQSMQPSPVSQQSSSSTEVTPQPPAPQQLAPIGFDGQAPSFTLSPQQIMPNGSGPLLTIPSQDVPGAISPPLYANPASHSNTTTSSAAFPYAGGADAVSDDMAMHMQLGGLAAFQQEQQQQQQQANQPQMDSVDPTLTGGIAPSMISTLNSSTGPGPIRQSRSRAASQSGYTSSGSRSRAASGSGYQVLLESRSRAASSASSVYPAYEKDEEGDDDDDHHELEHEIEVGGSGPATGRASQLGTVTPRMDSETKVRLDAIFLEYLADVCSNLDITDSKGETIHQTLTAKKMEKLDQSADFRPFRFRIQAFTNAFAERVQSSGVLGVEPPIKKIREYLWEQPYISRFNHDGKKAKSRGNHIWTVEAKKIPGRKWIFREFARCIKGSAPAVAFIGLNWQWAPRVWDPQRSSDSIDASFMSPALPEWLSWENNVLSGLVPESAYGQNYEIEAVATFQMGDKVQQLKATTRFFVASPDETEDPAAFALLAAGGHPDLAGEYAPGDEPRQPGSREASPGTSPIAPQTSLYRSPSGGSSSAFDSGSQSHGRLLPPLGSAGSSFGGSVLGTPANAFDSGYPQLNARQLHEREQQRFQAHLQQVSAQIPGSGSNDSGGDMNVDETQATIDAQAQAALHQHYSTIAMQQGVSFQGVTPDQLSFAPPPELVQNALQDAVPVDSAFTSLDSTMLTAPMSAEDDAFQLHVMGQQPPFSASNSIDPSTL